MTVKNRVKEFLDARGITPYRFKLDAGISQSTAYDLYNRPEQLPRSAVLDKICRTYQVQPGELLEWVGPQVDANS